MFQVQKRFEWDLKHYLFPLIPSNPVLSAAIAEHRPLAFQHLVRSLMVKCHWISEETRFGS